MTPDERTEAQQGPPHPAALRRGEVTAQAAGGPHPAALRRGEVTAQAAGGPHPAALRQARVAQDKGEVESAEEQEQQQASKGPRKGN